jgi:hypothetical protein
MQIKLSIWLIECVDKGRMVLEITTDHFHLMKWTRQVWLFNRTTTPESMRCCQMLLSSKCSTRLKWVVLSLPKLVNYLLTSKLTTVILSVKMVLPTKVIKQIKIISMLMKLFKRTERMGIIIELVLPLLTEQLLNSKFLICLTNEKLLMLINNRWWWPILSLIHLKTQLGATRSQRI